MEGSNLTVENSQFVDNENGILAGGPPSSVVRITRALFRGNGTCQSACAHALYIGKRIARLEVTGCVFHEHPCRTPHQVPGTCDDRARQSDRGWRRRGTSSYLIELPDGGDGVVMDNILRKGANSQNKEVAISIGTENRDNPTRGLVIRGNQFTSELPEPVRFVRNATETPARLTGNVLTGNVIPLDGPGTVE